MPDSNSEYGFDSCCEYHNPSTGLCRVHVMFEQGRISERKRIVAWLREQWPYGSNQLSGSETCPHDYYKWESCDDCTIDYIAKLIEEGAHNEQ